MNQLVRNICLAQRGGGGGGRGVFSCFSVEKDIGTVNYDPITIENKLVDPHGQKHTRREPHEPSSTAALSSGVLMHMKNKRKSKTDEANKTKKRRIGRSIPSPCGGVRRSRSTGRPDFLLLSFLFLAVTKALHTHTHTHCARPHEHIVAIT